MKLNFTMPRHCIATTSRCWWRKEHTTHDNAPVETVHFLVHGKTAHYLHTKPIHGSQVAKWHDDDTLDITLNVKINQELKNILLSYAPNITILAPQSLVEEHKKSLQKALEQYK